MKNLPLIEAGSCYGNRFPLKRGVIGAREIPARYQRRPFEAGDISCISYAARTASNAGAASPEPRGLLFEGPGAGTHQGGHKKRALNTHATNEHTKS